MTESFQELRAAYHEAAEDGRADMVSAFEELLPDPAVVDFLLGVAADTTEYDLARVEALKLFQLFRSDDEPTHQRIGNSVATVLKEDTDTLVRQWAAIALEFNYHDIPEVRRVVIERLLDAEEELNTRHNCMAVLRRADRTPDVREALGKLRDDPELGRYVVEKSDPWLGSSPYGSSPSSVLPS